MPCFADTQGAPATRPAAAAIRAGAGRATCLVTAEGGAQRSIIESWSEKVLFDLFFFSLVFQAGREKVESFPSPLFFFLSTPNHLLCPPDFI